MPLLTLTVGSAALEAEFLSIVAKGVVERVGAWTWDALVRIELS